MPYHSTPTGVAHDQSGEAGRLLTELIKALDNLEQMNEIRYSRGLLIRVGVAKSLGQRAYEHWLRSHRALFVELHSERSEQQARRNGRLRGGEWNGAPNKDILAEREQVYADLTESGDPDGLIVFMHGLSDTPDTLDTAEFVSDRLRTEQAA